MQGLILIGNKDNEKPFYKLAADAISEEMSSWGWHVEKLYLNEFTIKRCTGCFDCWVKTPGVCVTDDFGREVAKKAADSDVMVFLTELIYGGYHPDLKKAIDRLIPNVSPLMKKVKGEVHHIQRYPKTPALVGIGALLEKDVEALNTFKILIERNAINFNSPLFKFGMIYKTQAESDIKKTIKTIFDEVKKGLRI